MASIFTKIINGDIPCYKVAEDEKHIAFLDIHPLAEGHTLVVPKVEVDYIFDMDDAALASLQLFAKKVARAMDRVMECKRVGQLVIGTEVPHTHIHLIPFKDEAQMAITSSRIKLSSEEMTTIAERIAAAV